MKKKTGKKLWMDEYIDVCDFCGKQFDAQESVVLDYRWNDGYDYFGDKIETCSMGCLFNELGKHVPEDVFKSGIGTITLRALPKDIKSLLENSFGSIIGA